MAPIRLSSVRCYCGDIATFYQSKKDNLNHGSYFFGCSNWQNNNCKYFCWASEYHATPDPQILRRLIPNGAIEPAQQPVVIQNHNEIDSNAVDAIPNRYECIICLTAERSCLFTPCNHVCCCLSCAQKVQTLQRKCPICRVNVQSIQQLFFV